MKSCFPEISEANEKGSNAAQINSLPSFLSALSRNRAASSKTCTFFRKVLICSMWESLELKTSLKGQLDISKSCWSKRDASESKKNSSVFKLLLCLSLLAIFLFCFVFSFPLSFVRLLFWRRAERSKQWGSYQWMLLLSDGSSFLFFLFFMNAGCLMWSSGQCQWMVVHGKTRARPPSVWGVRMVLVPVCGRLSVISVQNKRLQINTHIHMSAWVYKSHRLICYFTHNRSVVSFYVLVSTVYYTIHTNNVMS